MPSCGVHYSLVLLYLGFSLLFGFNKVVLYSSHLSFLPCPQPLICFSDSTPFTRTGLRAPLRNAHQEPTAEWGKVWVQHWRHWGCLWTQGGRFLGELLPCTMGRFLAEVYSLISKNPVTFMSFDILICLFPSLPLQLQLLDRNGYFKQHPTQLG